MESAKYVIVGGGIAGSTAATTIRQHDANGRIIVITNEPYRLYSRLALSSVLHGQTNQEQVELRTAASYSNHAIEVWTDSLVTSLDPAESVITMADGQRVHFDKLLLATGSSPRHWSVTGSSLAGVLSLRTLSDALQIAQRLPKAKHALVVGGGFIALEHIQTLTKLGIATTVIIRDPYYWAGLWDEESGQLLQNLLAQAVNVRLLFDTHIELLEGTSIVQAAVLSNGQRLPTDLVLVAIGVEPELKWLQGSSLDTSGGIATDAFLQTSIENIWAAGDVAVFDDQLLGARHRLGNWDNASAQGELAGQNMTSSTPIAFKALTTYSISLFGTNISFIGDVHHHSRMIAIPRGSARSGAYGRLLLHQDRLVGATLINRFTERTALEKIIRSRLPLRKQDILDLTDESVAVSDVAKRLTATHKN
jgi:3-phenylpropionate/trans-cinnamate dioxygenase ferredoxin reductase subunit